MIFLEHKVAPKVLKYMVFVLDLVGEVNKTRMPRIYIHKRVVNQNGFGQRLIKAEWLET